MALPRRYGSNMWGSKRRSTPNFMGLGHLKWCRVRGAIHFRDQSNLGKSWRYPRDWISHRTSSLVGSSDAWFLNQFWAFACTHNRWHKHLILHGSNQFQCWWYQRLWNNLANRASANWSSFTLDPFIRQDYADHKRSLHREYWLLCHINCHKCRIVEAFSH